VKFLIDAQLPHRLARSLGTLGHDAVHTRDLPKGNRTTDAEVCRLADLDGRVVVTKDADFVSSHLLSRKPSRLLLVSVGNIANNDLEQRVFAELPALVLALSDAAFVELTTTGIVVHED
jgi:predicted nuclease of predicted toxin-antitoxin system